jgi:hypothetical protein
MVCEQVVLVLGRKSLSASSIASAIDPLTGLHQDGRAEFKIWSLMTPQIVVTSTALFIPVGKTMARAATCGQDP